MTVNFARFRKPSRYIGREINLVKKEAEVKTALCFPDTYEIGMSHLGLKILYFIINNLPYASAERVYAPWGDYESFLRHNDLPLASLEFSRPLKSFDIVGFTLQYELSYTNILNMLDLGAVPLRSEERDDSHPLVIAGGPCAVNPEPLLPFIDAFVIGDGEDVIRDILEGYRVFRRGPGSRDRQGILKALASREGIFVPSVHDSRDANIRRRIVHDLDAALFPASPIVPYASIVHDRVSIEIARGCSRGCRFCQAGMIYRPVRERSMENVLSLAQKSIESTGFEEISFSSLSAGDYSRILPLIQRFNDLCKGSHTSVSLPSIRVGSISSPVLRAIKSVRKTGFTIAPEAGTKRLRAVINKDFSDEEYDETLHKLYSEGWKHIKLYFMVGLPTETQADIDGLIDMAVKASRKGREVTKSRVSINAGISAFVPKPHTPFQWTGQSSVHDLREKQEYIRRAFRKRGIQFKGQHVEHSLLEAVFSRADRSCASLLEAAWRSGCRFDGWSEQFNLDRWLEAAEKTGIDLQACASRTFGLDEALPWHYVDTGVSAQYLKTEYHRAVQGEITRDCRTDCRGCGIGCADIRTGDANPGGLPMARAGESVTPSARKDRMVTTPGARGLPVTRLRVKYSKTGVLRYLSHHELMTALLRALRRTRVPVSYSSGFHPHPKISFGPALPLGAEGLHEYFDIELFPHIHPREFIERLNCRLPEGITIRDAFIVPLHAKSLNAAISRYAYEVRVDSSAIDKITSFINSKSCLVQRDSKTVDIRPLVETACVKDNILHLVLADTDTAQARLSEILKEMLPESAGDIYCLKVRRTGLSGYNTSELKNPVEDKLIWAEK